MTGRNLALTVFYGHYADRLRAAVKSRVQTTDATIPEDACQFAWLTLVRREDVALSERGFAWLAAVAIREGWRLARIPRAVPSGAFRGDDDLGEHEHSEPLAMEVDLEARAIARSEHDARASALKQLKPIEARDLYLLAAGYSYAEIAERTGSTYSPVNHHIVTGRAKLARLRTGRVRQPAPADPR